MQFFHILLSPSRTRQMRLPFLCVRFFIFFFGQHVPYGILSFASPCLAHTFFSVLHRIKLLRQPLSYKQPSLKLSHKQLCSPSSLSVPFERWQCLHSSSPQVNMQSGGEGLSLLRTCLAGKRQQALVFFTQENPLLISDLFGKINVHCLLHFFLFSLL